jgi:hypothetical protein
MCGGRGARCRCGVGWGGWVWEPLLWNCEAVVFGNSVELLNSPLQLLVGRIGESELFSEQVSSYRH